MRKAEITCSVSLGRCAAWGKVGGRRLWLVLPVAVGGGVGRSSGMKWSELVSRRAVGRIRRELNWRVHDTGVGGGHAPEHPDARAPIRQACAWGRRRPRAREQLYLVKMRDSAEGVARAPGTRAMGRVAWLYRPYLLIFQESIGLIIPTILWHKGDKWAWG